MEGQGLFQPQVEMQVQNELQSWIIEEVGKVIDQDQKDDKFVRGLLNNFLDFSNQTYHSIVNTHKKTVDERI